MNAGPQSPGRLTQLQALETMCQDVSSTVHVLLQIGLFVVCCLHIPVLKYWELVCWPICNDVCFDKRREIMWYHNVQGHLSQWEDWIIFVSLETHIVRHCMLFRICRSIRWYFKHSFDMFIVIVLNFNCKTL